MVRSPRFARWLWPALAVLAACVPFAGGFSLTKIFYIRDLTMFFWPRHLWIHRSLTAGAFPLWDPYAAAGQASYSDALNQLFLPPVLALRTLSPAVLSFNLVVLLPFPLAALGMWLFLARRFSPLSATLGAIVFATSGAVVSTGNFPNLSWSVAWIPWLLWAVDRDRAVRSRRSFAMVALLVAFEMLSGEPVTMMGALSLLIAWVLVSSDRTSGVERGRAAIRVVAAITVAGLLAAVQLVPMALAAKASPRGMMQTDNFWSLHPLWLTEMVLPHVFGHPFYTFDSQLPWLRPLNSGRDPFFYSLYVGPIVMLLSCVGALGGPRRWRVFWAAVAAVGLVLSFGDYTPVYPALQRVVPVLASLRFPTKFFLFTSLGLAMLAANGAEVLRHGSRPGESSSAIRATMAVVVVVAVALVALMSLVLVIPFTGARAFYELGAMVGVADPIAGAEYLFRSMPAIAARVLILLLVSAALAYFGSRATREGQIARFLLVSLAVIELISVNVDVNPVLPASALGPPAWTAAIAAHSADRFYFGGKFRGSLVQRDIDLQGVEWRPRQGVTVEEGRTLMIANMAMTPAAWGVRELISYDLPRLWPVEHATAEYVFEHADRERRIRFLASGGVRFCLLPSPPHAGAAPLQRVGEQFGTMAVYECVADARRAAVIANASIVPSVTSQLEQLFDASFDAGATVMLERPAPDAAGSPGTPSAPTARITTDADAEVSIDAAAGADGGYLLLRDTFDPAWRVEVDGRPAALLRADALYRAVHIAAGPHTVRFAYRPTVFYASLIGSSVAALTLAAFALSRRAPLTDASTPRERSYRV
jgi:hypothetical protein